MFAGGHLFYSLFKFYRSTAVQSISKLFVTYTFLKKKFGAIFVESTNSTGILKINVVVVERDQITKGATLSLNRIVFHWGPFNQKKLPTIISDRNRGHPIGEKLMQYSGLI